MKLFLTTLSIIFSVAYANAQFGLEKIVVEKYYVSDANDAKAISGGHLPVGSVTYRIFVDLFPVYRFQAAFGIPGHELKIATTTSFYNHEVYGASIAKDIPVNVLDSNTAMLDSWVSVGTVYGNNYGVMKDEDTSKAITNVNGLLQNIDVSAGIPIKERDGFYIAPLLGALVAFGIDSELVVLGNKNEITKGQIFSTSNGSWACFGGTIGATKENRVLIAQITTDGDFSFELNIQIGTPSGGVEQYVARNPKGAEILLPSLIYPVPEKRRR